MINPARTDNLAGITNRSLQMKEFKWLVRVYYEDTDAGGIVYHTSYLKYMERARTEYLRALGYSQTQLRGEQGILFVVSRIHINFKRPAVFDDELTVTAALSKTSRANLMFHQTICRNEEQLCEADIAVACLSADRYTPKRMPTSLLAEFTHDS